MPLTAPSSALVRPDLVLDIGPDVSLDVREFSVIEALSRLFVVELTCVSPDPDLDLESIVGRAGRFAIQRGESGQSRVFRGVVRTITQAEPEDKGLATYRLVIVPALWLLAQNRTYRIFQDQTDPATALSLVTAHGLSADARLAETYKPRRYRVQYAESDFAFASRLLEDAGVTYYFDTGGSGDGALVLTDKPSAGEPRAPLPFVGQPNDLLRQDFVTQVELRRAVTPGRYTQEDLDYRRPADFAVRASTASGLDVETHLELYHYNPGALLFAASASGADTPFADDRGPQRTDLVEGGRQTEKRLAAKRGAAKRCHFATSALDVRPGSVVSFLDHPHAELGPGRRFLVVAATLRGTATGAWSHRCEAQPVEAPFRPALVTPRPRANGVESATVVGPAGEEIHTDELGRARVHFHWDREGSFDASASCWIPVNQPWAGRSFGALNIPRIGQEVLVDFLGADPDRPVILGRVFTHQNPVPYDLPRFQDLQGFRSESTPKLPAGVARSGMLGGKTAGGGDGAGTAGPQSSPLGGGMPLSLADIAKALGGSRFFQGGSPDQTTHLWQGSELTMHDTQGAERVYMQAQKDLHKVVKNHHVEVVGHSKSEKIGTDNVRQVENSESFVVGSDRTGLVGGEQREVVQLAAYHQTVEGGHQFEAATSFSSRSTDHTFVTEETFGSQAPMQAFASRDLMKFTCGDSMLLLKPEGIVIQGAVTHLDPGDAFVAALLQGHSMLSAKLFAETAAVRDAERKRAAEIRDAFDNTTALYNHLPENGQYEPNGTAFQTLDDLHYQAWRDDLGGLKPPPTIEEYRRLITGDFEVPPVLTPSPVTPAVDA